jgi:hypothetical protein
LFCQKGLVNGYRLKEWKKEAFFNGDFSSKKLFA